MFHNFTKKNILSPINSPSKKLLVIASEWPEPNSSAAGGRMMQLLEIFLTMGFHITYAATAHISNFMFDIESIGITLKNVTLNDDSVDDFIKKINPTIVLFDRFTAEEQFGWRVVRQCPAAIRILDTEDLHFLRKARQESIQKYNNLDDLDLQSGLAKREIASVLRCDLSLIISRFEMNLLENEFDIKPNLLLYLPFLFDEIDEKVSSEWLDFEARKNFIFVGNFFHKPNIDAVLTLKNEIWPRIIKLQKGLQIDVFGAYPIPKIMQLHNTAAGFLVHGRAENAKAVVGKAKVVLAPIRFGAGIKGKLAEAQFCGTPSITTKIGSESMTKNELWNGFITDNYDDFAQKAIQLYNQEKLWKKAQTVGIKIFNEQYNKALFSKKFIDMILYLLENLEHHRKKNFLGAMLLHHSMQSTKFLSKWIIAKNK